MLNCYKGRQKVEIDDRERNLLVASFKDYACALGVRAYPMIARGKRKVVDPTMW